MQATISYGKCNAALYRTYASPLVGIPPIPESAFTGRDNTLVAVDVSVEVFGDNFLPAYTHGDNSNVVPTDTMKNFILQQALVYDGATLEGLLEWLGCQLLATYPQMQRLRLTGTELPFAAVSVPQPDSAAFAASGVLFSPSHNDRAMAALDCERGAEGEPVRVTDHRCGRVGMQLVKLTGSSFAGFPQDAYTTLPERVDRPLFIYLDVYWRYADVAALLAPQPVRYVAAEQVRDLVQVVFHSFVSRSIQHLLHEMGTRLLARFPQLDEVTLQGQNRLWDTAYVAAHDPSIKVYCDPRPPYGVITLRLGREAAEGEGRATDAS